MSFRVFTICVEKKSSINLLMDVVALVSGNRPGHVHAVHVLPSGIEFIPLSPYYQGAPLVNLYDEYLAIAADIKSTYEKCQLAHPESITWDWHEYRGSTPLDFSPYIEHSIASDLVVCSKRSSISMGSDLPRSLVIDSEVPVLVVPEDLKLNNPFERIMIAWNETPEAASAIRDALPLLKQAELVVLVNLFHNRSDGVVKGTDMARYLGEHDISVEIDNRKIQGDIGPAILRQVSDNYMDLLVMGGFGHSRLYNMVLGAATPQILKELSCPVFLSK